MRFIIGFLLAIGLLITAFVLIFHGHGSSSNTTATGVKLIDYANTSKVMQLTTEGPVNADQTHSEVRISVGSTQTTIDVFQGYEQTLVSSKSYASNPAAYADFLKALDLAGYTKGNTDKSVADERGYCATGDRYILGIKDGDKDTQRFWTSTCGIGTFKGKISLVRGLFIDQIPDYDNQTANVQL